METFEAIDLGPYRGDDYFLVGYVDPAPSNGDAYNPKVDAENYGWSLVQKKESPLDENIEIVRLDTRHGQPHMDKEYLPLDSDENSKTYLDDGYSFRRMKRFLLANWTQFADLHIYHNE